MRRLRARNLAGDVGPALLVQAGREHGHVHVWKRLFACKMSNLGEKRDFVFRLIRVDIIITQV